jgi:hypothetical protein
MSDHEADWRAAEHGLVVGCCLLSYSTYIRDDSYFISATPSLDI